MSHRRDQFIYYSQTRIVPGWRVRGDSWFPAWKKRSISNPREPLERVYSRRTCTTMQSDVALIDLSRDEIESWNDDPSSFFFSKVGSLFRHPLTHRSTKSRERNVRYEKEKTIKREVVILCNL